MNNIDFEKYVIERIPTAEKYVIERTPTATSRGDVFFYINKNINFKLRNVLKIYKNKELDSDFTEIINKKEIYTIADVYTGIPV